MKFRLVGTAVFLLVVLSSSAQVTSETNYLFYRKQMGPYPYADSIPRDTVFAFGGFVQLRGSTAHFESLFEDDDSNRMFERWRGPRVQDISYKIKGEDIQLKAAQSMEGLILKGDTINWSRLKNTSVQCLLIPFRLSDKLKPFKGTWSLDASTGYQFILDFGRDVFQYEPFMTRQEAITEWPKIKLALPGGVTFIDLDNGSSRILYAAHEVLSLSWDEKKGSYVVEGFPNQIDWETKHYRFTGTFTKLALPTKSVLTKLEERLIGNWVSIGTWGKKNFAGDTVTLSEEYTIQFDKRIMRLTGFSEKTDTFEKPWRLSTSGRLIIVNGNEHRPWPVWCMTFVGETLLIHVPFSVATPYSMKGISFRKK